jgi:hypothetical protein
MHAGIRFFVAKNILRGADNIKMLSRLGAFNALAVYHSKGGDWALSWGLSLKGQF